MPRFDRLLALLTLAPLLGGCEAATRIQAAAMVGPIATVGPAIEPGEPVDTFADDGTPLHGYLVRPQHPARARGHVLLLHGMGDASGFWRDEAIALARSGLFASAWDGRGHGQSGGLCTYGAKERNDVHRELDALARRGVPVERTILYGYSMGGAIAIQSAVEEPRVRGVAAVAPFAELDGVLRRVLWAAPRALVAEELKRAEAAAAFRIGSVEPVEAARRLKVPLLLVVGSSDERAPPTDSWAIASAAAAPTEVLLVEGADHGDVLRRCGYPCDRALGALARAAGM